MNTRRLLAALALGTVTALTGMHPANAASPDPKSPCLQLIPTVGCPAPATGPTAGIGSDVGVGSPIFGPFIPTPTPAPAPMGPGSIPHPSPSPNPGPSAHASAPATSPAPAASPSPSPTLDDSESPLYGGSSLMDTMLGDAAVVVAPDGTRVPLDHFDIGNGAGRFDGPGRTTGAFTDWVFSFDAMAVGFIAWLVRFAYEFGFGELLAPMVTGLTRLWQTSIVGPLGLWGFMATIAGCWAALIMIRGRFTRGIGELLVSGIVAAIAGAVLHDPGAAILGPHGVMGTARSASLTVAAVTVTGDIETGTGPRNAADTDPKDAAGPLTAKLTETFIVQPHQILDWGRTFKPGTPCAKVYWHLVETGPHGRDGDARDKMKACGPDGEDAAKFNASPSIQRLGSAVIIFTAIALTLLLVGVLGVAFLIAQVGAAFAALRALPELLVAMLPGAGRSRLWRWLAAIGVSVAAVVASGAFLAVFLTVVGAVFTHTQSAPLLVRFFCVDLASLFGLFAWFKHRKSSRRATLAATRMANQHSLLGGGQSPHGVAITVPTMGDRIQRGGAAVAHVAAPIAEVAAVGIGIYTMNPAIAAAAAKRLAGHVGTALRDDD